MEKIILILIYRAIHSSWNYPEYWYAFKVLILIHIYTILYINPLEPEFSLKF